VFVLQLVGYTQTKNYDASMGEWANREDTPLEV
jgi:3-mercaptopyruvate sulfurtransferase SseA